MAKKKGSEADSLEASRKRARANDRKRPSSWWTAHERKESAHRDINAAITEMGTRQSDRRSAYARWAFAYGEDIKNSGRPTAPDLLEGGDDRLSINHLSNIIDTVHADVFKTRTLPMPQLIGADYQTYKRAQKLGRFYEGLFDELSFFNKLQLHVGLYVLICGDGWLKSFIRNGRIAATVVPSWNVFINDTEAYYGDPRTMFERVPYDRYVALEDYGYSRGPDDGLYGTEEERVEGILDSSLSADDTAFLDVGYGGDQIMLTEAWHLPSAPGAGDGRHVVCTDKVTLIDEPYEYDTFPFRSMKAGITLVGVRGPSTVARILPAQREHDELSGKIQRSHALLGVPRILLPKESGISLEHIDDEVGSILTTNGNVAPVVWNAEPIHPSTYQYRASLKDEMSAEVGVSQYASQSQIPQGMSNASGKALQLVGENDSGRHIIKHKLLEQFVLECADMFFDRAEELAKSDPEFSVLVTGRHNAEPIKWKEVRVDRKSFRMIISPANALSKTPGAKFDQLMRMRESGEISSAEFRYMFEMPDLEKLNGVAVSDLESIDKKIEAMIFDGEYRNPSPFDDLKLCVKRGSQLYNYFDLENAPDARLAMIRQFVDKAVQMQQAASATGQGVQPPAPPVGAMPPAPMDQAAVDPMAGGTPPMMTGM